MKLFSRFLLIALALVSFDAMAQPIPTTAGSNLTAWNGGSGATNNNQWNSLMNNRSGGVAASAPEADFGNCNALVLRCAQPKCATGGCTSMDITMPIVSGCVMDNETCKKHGDQLIQTIAAQLVANSNAKAQQAQLAAQQAAAQQAAAQNSQQMQQMQAQMQQMQAEMAAQNAATVAQLESALAEQKELNAQAIANATAAQKQIAEQQAAQSANTATTELTQAQIEAAERGVSADLLAREQITGQIMSKLENADTLMKKLNVTMQEAFKYAGCDPRGNNCSGPKRVKVFKQKAQEFFIPFDDIVDEVYEALEMSLAVGVDVSDVVMMLSGACNQWGKFLCVGVDGKHEVETYDNKSCVNGRSVKGQGFAKGGQECTPNMAIPPQDDSRCTLTELISEGGDPVLREWVDENDEGDRLVRVGCATSALDSVSIFGRRRGRKGAALDLDTLERILAQDAPDYVASNRYTQGTAGKDEGIERIKYCALTPRSYQTLLSAVQTKKLPSKICVPYDSLYVTAYTDGALTSGGFQGTGLATGYVNASNCSKCLDWNVFASDGCSLEWEQDGETYKDACPKDLVSKPEGRCKVTGDKCVNEDGKIYKRETHPVNTSVATNESFGDYKTKCILAGGDIDGFVCRCKGTKACLLQLESCQKGEIFNPDTHRCFGGLLVKKELNK